MTVILNMINVSLQLAIHVVQNRHAGEQKLHWDKTKQKTYIILNDNFLCFVLSQCDFCSFSKAVLYHNILHKGLFRACLHGGGGPQAGEVTSLGGVTRLSI